MGKRIGPWPHRLSACLCTLRHKVFASCLFFCVCVWFFFVLFVVIVLQNSSAVSARVQLKL